MIGFRVGRLLDREEDGGAWTVYADDYAVGDHWTMRPEAVVVTGVSAPGVQHRSGSAERVVEAWLTAYLVATDRGDEADEALAAYRRLVLDGWNVWTDAIDVGLRVEGVPMLQHKAHAERVDDAGKVEWFNASSVARASAILKVAEAIEAATS